MLGHKKHTGTFKTKESRAGLIRVSLSWKSHCVICVLAYFIPYHVTGSYKGPIERGLLNIEIRCSFIASFDIIVNN